jgi:hypothetical protein
MTDFEHFLDMHERIGRRYDRAKMIELSERGAPFEMNLLFNAAGTMVYCAQRLHGEQSNVVT